MSQQLTTTTTPRTPSPRDLDVYKRAKIWRLPQWEVAYDLKLHYSSISKIVKRVERWLAAGGDPLDPQITDFAARQRLAETNARLRLTRAIELATSAVEIKPDPEPIVRRRLVNGVEVWREETEKPVPSLNLPALRTLVSATTALQRLHNQTAQPSSQPPTQQSSPEKLLAAIIDLLTTLRHKAESLGKVPTTADAHITVVTTLNTLLGDSLCSQHAPRAVPSHDRSPSLFSVPASSLALQEPEAPASSTANTPGESLPPASTLNLERGTVTSPPPAAVQETGNLTNLNDPSSATNVHTQTTSSLSTCIEVKNLESP